MFLLSKTVDPTTSLTYARVDLDQLTGEQRIEKPRFSSVTEDGTAISFSARSALPDPDKKNVFTADELHAHIALPDATFVDLSAPQAIINGVTNMVDLSGEVKLTTSTNYHITAQGLRTSMDVTSVQTRGELSAKGPLGELTAGQAIITQDTDSDAGYLLVFKEGVKLIYTPQSNLKGE